MTIRANEVETQDLTSENDHLEVTPPKRSGDAGFHE